MGKTASKKTASKPAQKRTSGATKKRAMLNEKRIERMTVCVSPELKKWLSFRANLDRRTLSDYVHINILEPYVMANSEMVGKEGGK